MFFLACALNAATIHFEAGTFRLEGLPPAADPASFQVYAGTGETPMLGSYAVEGTTLVFHPRFPLASGVRYRAVYRPTGAAPVEAIFDGPKPAAGPATEVVAIYPTAGVVPANTLKFYVAFSAPMSRGDAYKHLKLMDQSGKTRELAILEIQQELWDPEYRRFTVLFNPGRIKRGLVPNQEDGPPFEAGKSYKFVVDRQWRDARGLPLRSEFVKEFTVADAERMPPEPKQWRIAAPRAGTREPVTIDFGRAMDYALLNRVIEVLGVAGVASTAREEHEWRFTPVLAWKPGEYRIEIDTLLEDLAGNGVGRPFDVDVFDRVTERIERKTVTLSFRAD